MSEVARPFRADAYRLRACVLGRLRAPEDARSLADMLIGLEPWRTLGYTADGLVRYFARGLVRYFARDDPGLHRYRIVAHGAAAGVVFLRYPWLRGAYIELIGIGPGGPGRGLGGDVVAWIENETRAPNLWALVSSFNEPARRFYARQGFIEIAPLEDLVAKGHQEILVRKPL